MDTCDTYRAGGFRIPRRVCPENFYNNPLPLVGRLVDPRETTSVEGLAVDFLQFSGKKERLGKNPRDTAQLL